VRFPYWLIVLLFVPQLAWALDCGQTSDLEMAAYRGRLTLENRACLESTLQDGDPSKRAEASFVMIIDAYAAGRIDDYSALMRRHLTDIHTQDAEVAFLYATHLWRENGPSDDVLKWSRVAMDGRRRWLSNRNNYDNMVKSLYDMMVQVSMERAIEVETQYIGSPTPENRARTDTYKRQARYYLIVAAPCLHYGDCGPYYEVEVEGWAPCDDLVALEAQSKRGAVPDTQMTCLRSKYRKPQSPKQRILTIMMAQADTDSEGKVWDTLLAWHWNLTGMDDPLLAYRYADFLVGSGVQEAEQAMKWAKIALNSKEGFSGRTGRHALERLHTLRLQTAQRLLAVARTAYEKNPNPFNQQSVTDASVVVNEAQQARQAYCESNRCSDESRPTSTTGSRQ